MVDERSQQIAKVLRQVDSHSTHSASTARCSARRRRPIARRPVCSPNRHRLPHGGSRLREYWDAPLYWSRCFVFGRGRKRSRQEPTTEVSAFEARTGAAKRLRPGRSREQRHQDRPGATEASEAHRRAGERPARRGHPRHHEGNRALHLVDRDPAVEATALAAVLSRGRSAALAFAQQGEKQRHDEAVLGAPGGGLDLDQRR